MFYILAICVLIIFFLIYFLIKKLKESKLEKQQIKKQSINIAKSDSELISLKDELYKLNFLKNKLDEDFDRLKKELIGYKEKYKDPDALFDIVNKKNKEIYELDIQKKEKEAQIVRVQGYYSEKMVLYKNLLEKISLYDEEVGLIEMGLYKPHFDYGTSELYKVKINENRNKQKLLIKSKQAVYCATDWIVRNSKSDGRKFSERSIRLTLRAFNNECDAIISNTRWNNINKMQQRMRKAFDDINNLNASNSVIITTDYLNLKLGELWMVYEYKDKLQAEKEEQAEIRRQIREEAKLEQEVAAAQKEEEKYHKMLERAQREAEKSMGSNLDRLNSEIAQLSIKLEEAHQKSERAISMAQQTRAGHVYVISNTGSFGENVYKIGMTRRLEPMERVKELGDASVPFYFDVHAMIYSEDAPSMENALHKAFADRRLNLVNLRKEFFNVGLDEIQQEVGKISKDAEFVMTIEAQEFHQSQMIRRNRESKEVIIQYDIPEKI